MASAYEEVQRLIRLRPRRWLITGVAGFIGSHLLEALLKLDQAVVGLDNYATGYARNLEEVKDAVGAAAWRQFTFIEGDIRALADCQRACAGVDVVLHHAALGSVPRSVEDPLVRLLQFGRGQGGGRAWGISHALPGARRRMAYLGPSWVPGIGSANDWPRRYACT